MGVSAAYSFIQTTNGYIGLSSFEQRMITKVDKFTVGGTFTVPAGVTYAVAHITAGGGGVGGSPGDGGTSSVAFAGGTISSIGGKGLNNEGLFVYAAATNSGFGAYTSGTRTDTTAFGNKPGNAGNGALIVAGAAVTPAATITVTVGAGGVAGANGAAGGSGYVYIEYQVKA